MEAWYFIAGLGNPGAEYAQTRHNAGFLVLERLAERWEAAWGRSRRFAAEVARCRRGGKAILLCRPVTFMNLSGQAVGGLVGYHRIPLERVMVVADDADLPLGTVRMRPGGSSGGHHGLESVEQHLGARTYGRLRVGIGRTVGSDREITDYVLGRFAAGERELMGQVVERAVAQLECWVTEGIGRAMNRFNGTILNAETTCHEEIRRTVHPESGGEGRGPEGRHRPSDGGNHHGGRQGGEHPEDG